MRQIDFSDLGNDSDYGDQDKRGSLFKSEPSSPDTNFQRKKEQRDKLSKKSKLGDKN